jgi:cation diffusion facilitator family transporter
VEAGNTRSRRVEQTALTAVGVTLVLAIAKVGVWLATSSLAILSQALDSALDVIALGLLYVGLRVASKPADVSHHYGHAKAEHLVAFTQTLFLGLVALTVAWSAVWRLLDDQHSVTTPWYAFVLLGASAVIDAVRVRSLYASGREEGSDALLAGALNLFTDIGTAAVAFVSLLLVRLGLAQADAIGALIVAALVSVPAIRLGRRAIDVLMDRAPQSRVAAIEAAANRAAGVTETRRIRVRGTGDQVFADVTVAAGRTATLERAHTIAEAVENEIQEAVPGTDVVVHVEPVSETSGLIERVQAAASRVEGIHEVHNVEIHAFNEGGRSKLHATLHAKVPSMTSLMEAHRLADEVEAAVEQELGSEVRVDSHIEPMRSTEIGRDVTSARQDIVQSVVRLALEEPDIVDCHEVIVTSSNGKHAVVAHIRGRPDIPLARIHEASDRIEKAVHNAHPEVGTVTLHFEPV